MIFLIPNLTIRARLALIGINIQDRGIFRTYNGLADIGSSVPDISRQALPCADIFVCVIIWLIFRASMASFFTEPGLIRRAFLAL